jgi:hypothetical protein
VTRATTTHHCAFCLSERYGLRWQTIADGRKQIRRICLQCHRADFAPQTPENVALADAAPLHDDAPAPAQGSLW